MGERNEEPRFDASYDAVVVGAGNGGLGAGLALAVNGARPLVLEQHNIPGGFATSFVRGRFEFDVSLHELSDVGPDDRKGGVRKFLDDEAGLRIDWMRVPEAYRLILTGHDMNVRVPFGVREFIDCIEAEVPGSRETVTRYMNLCQDIYDTFGYLGRGGKPGPARMARDFAEFLKNASNPLKDARDLFVHAGNFLRAAPYTVAEVHDALGLPGRAEKIISPYWCYMGIPMDRLGFPIWAGMLVSYLIQGAYVPRCRSQEMTMAMESRIRELGGQIEYNTRVERILTKKGRVTGVVTADGHTIHTDHVIANASPNLVFGSLIEPAEVPTQAMKLVNARRVAASGFVVYMGLDAGPDDLGITDYGYFIAEDMNTREHYDAVSVLGPTKMQAATCLNRVVPDCSPPGTTILCITILHMPEAWYTVKPADYVKTKNDIAAALIKQFEEATGVELRGRIEEIEVATPVTFARYTGAFDGGIYGYEPDVWDSVPARIMHLQNERFVKGLEFAGGFALMGHGYSPSLLSGRAAALATLAQLGVKS
jgi:prolycopene isomerase